jgi:hypothetical protein
MNLPDLKKREKGKDVFIVGTGTSLVGFDWRVLNGRRVIALNDAIKSVRSAAYHLYTDNLFSRKYDKLLLPETMIICRNRSSIDLSRDRRFSFCRFMSAKNPGIANSHELYVFATVAVTAIHAAQRLGARRIFLLGIDAYRLPEKRYYDGRAKSNRKVYKIIEKSGDRWKEKQHLRWSKAMEVMRAYFKRHKMYPGPWPGPGVYNLSPHSTIESWQKVDQELVFKEGA